MSEIESMDLDQAKLDEINKHRVELCVGDYVILGVSKLTQLTKPHDNWHIATYGELEAIARSGLLPINDGQLYRVMNNNSIVKLETDECSGIHANRYHITSLELVRTTRAIYVDRRSKPETKISVNDVKNVTLKGDFFKEYKRQFGYELDPRLEEFRQKAKDQLDVCDKEAVFQHCMKWSNSELYVNTGDRPEKNILNHNGNQLEKALTPPMPKGGNQ